MAKGILYVMETVVPGLIKIGKTRKDCYNDRMYNLERHGYNNVTGLKRRFAIEVEDYQEKENMLDTLFEKNSVGNSELFALDIDMVIQLLSSFEGKQLYPENETKQQTFMVATENQNLSKIPNGIYYLNKTRKGFGKITAQMEIKNGICTVLKGSICSPITSNKRIGIRNQAKIINNILQEDIKCNSLSAAGFVVLGNNNNGWMEWKTEDKKPIDIFRKK